MTSYAHLQQAADILCKMFPESVKCKLQLSLAFSAAASNCSYSKYVCNWILYDHSVSDFKM
jgi:hypothetical protein